MDNADKQPNQQLLYEVNMYRRKINLEITAAEQQLASVERRLTDLKQDLYVYLGFLTAPILLCWVLTIVSGLFFSPITYIIFEVVKFIILCIYVIMLIPNIYNLTKTIILLWINRESDEPATLPPVESTHKGGKAPQEESYRMERDKLILVLSHYYIYREKLEQLHQKIHSVSCNMTLVELEYELEQLPIFEDIQPASSRTGAMGEQVKGKTKMIMCAIVLAVLLSVVIGIIG